VKLELFFSFLVTSVLIELTPGPNITYLALLALGEGRKAALAAVGGVALGLALLGGAAALGVAELILASDLLYQALRWAGVGFLFYMAVEAWLAKTEEVAESGVSHARHFRRGFLTNALNPKAALFYLTVLPTFIHREASVREQTLWLTVSYVGIATLVHLLLVFLAGWLRPLLVTPAREMLVRRVFALLLAAVAVWLIFVTHR
jgi:threonine/homoserine/homoserine lactone efflux protein